MYEKIKIKREKNYERPISYFYAKNNSISSSHGEKINS